MIGIILSKAIRSGTGAVLSTAIAASLFTSKNVIIIASGV